MSDPTTLAPPPAVPWWKRAINAVGGAITSVVSAVKGLVVGFGKWLCTWNPIFSVVVIIFGIFLVWMTFVVPGVVVFVIGIFALLCWAF